MNDVLSKLVDDGLLTPEKAKEVTAAAEAGKPLDDALCAANGVPEEKLLQALASFYDIPYVDLEKDGAKHAPSKEFLGKFPARILLDHKLMPLSENDDGVAIVTSRVFDNAGLDQLRLATGLDVHPVIAPAAEIDRFIKKYLGVGADTLQSMRQEEDESDVKVIEEMDEDLDLSSAAQDASIIKFVNQVMAEALELRATDVHVEPFEEQLRVRYRIDGVLQEANIPPQVRKYHAAIVSRIKILSHLDIAEKRVPQDGRIRLRRGGARDRLARERDPDDSWRSRRAANSGSRRCAVGHGAPGHGRPG